MKIVFMTISFILALIIGICYAGQSCDDLEIKFAQQTNGKYSPVIVMQSNGKITEKVISKIMVGENDPVDLTFEKKKSKPHQSIIEIQVNRVTIAHVIQNNGSSQKIITD